MGCAPRRRWGACVRAGDLRRKVVIQSRTTGQDTFGQQMVTWSDYMTGVPADIQSLTGRELIQAQAINASITHTIAIRYASQLADPIKVAAMRVVYLNAGVTRYFNIVSCINVDERNKEINLMAVEGLNAG